MKVKRIKSCEFYCKKKFFEKHYEFLIIKIVFDAVYRENNQHEQFITKQLIFLGKKVYT